MKRFFGVVLGLIVGVVAIFTTAFVLPKRTGSAEDSAKFIESNITGKQDIIRSDFKNFANIEAIPGTKNGTPYNPVTEDFADGYAITPNSDSYNQVPNWTTSIDEFKINDDQALYIWLYIPCNPEYNMYSLSISVEGSSSKKLAWTFDADRMSDMLTGEKKGWCLFGLRTQDADTPIVDPELNSIRFTLLRISYQATVIDSEYGQQPFTVKVSNSKLSFYHMFLGNPLSSSSQVNFQQAYSIYKFKNTYVAMGEQYYIGDSITITKDEIFDQVIVGKYDLLSTNYPDFSWELEYAVENYSPQSIQFGEKINFNQSGVYHVTIKIKEKNQILESLGLSSTLFGTVCNISLNFNSGVFMLGSFNNSSYEMKLDEQQVLAFSISEHFIKTDENYSIRVSNDDYAEIVETRTIGSTIYISVKAKKAGRVTVGVSATGRRAGDSQEQTYTSSAELVIYSDTVDNTWKMVVLWTILGIYGVGFICMLIIFLVKSRKNGVK